MCSCCSDMQKKMVSFGCSAFLILFAIILGTLWPSMSSKLLRDVSLSPLVLTYLCNKCIHIPPPQKLVIKNGSVNYQNWIRTPIPMYLEVYLFNWTNPQDLDKFPTVKPHFEEMGPYVFHEVHDRINLEWNENNTVTFNQRRTWNFDPELSWGSLDDTVTNLNVISLVS